MNEIEERTGESKYMGIKYMGIRQPGSEEACERISVAELLDENYFGDEDEFYEEDDYDPDEIFCDDEF